MHRSGTSALTRVLSFMGAALPAHLLGPSDDNRSGHWESLPLIRYHNTLLDSLDSNWQDWRALDLAGLSASQRKKIAAEIRDVLHAEYAAAPLFVVKDPRLCRFAPLFLEALDEASIEARAVLCLRNPLEVQSSLERRNRLGRTHSALLWLRHVLDAEASTRQRRRTIVSYEQLLLDWKSTVNDLSRRLKVRWPDTLREIADQVEAFLAPAQRHHSNTTEEVLLDPLLKDWVGEAYLALLALERDPADKGALAALDRVRRSFNEAAPILRAMLNEVASQSGEIARLEDLQTKLRNEETNAKGLAAKLKSHDAKIDRQASELEALKSELEERTEERNATTLKAASMEARLASIHASLAGRLHARETELKEAKEEVKRRLEQTKKELERRTAEGSLLREKVRNLEATLAGIYSSSSWRVTAPIRAVGQRSAWLRRALRPAVTLAAHLATLPTRIGSRFRLWRDMSLLRKSDLFDQVWYLSRYPDVAAARVDPVRHYLLHGAQEGRDPGADFDTRFYLAKYRDVNNAGVNPLAHYLRLGRGEGRLRCASAHGKAVSRATGDIDSPANFVELLNGQLGAYHALWYGARAQKIAASRNALLALRRMAGNPAPPVIIVPVYNAVKETEACLQSLLTHTTSNCRIVVIDDASPDPQVSAMLARYHDRAPIEVVRNETNCGFTRTINRGIELAGRSDVVLLNSDTQVTPGWLRNLRMAAYSGDRVGTATPFSNNAGAFSAPEIEQDNPLPAAVALDDCARAISQTSLRSYPQTPTGTGFCMYIRRECLDATGTLDAEAFPRGYGEENDFCMRAGRLGWSHVVDDATLIFHVRSASFGETRNELRERGRVVIDQRYPEYTGAVREFIASDSMRTARERVREVQSAIAPGIRVKPRVAFVISTRTGGTPQTNQDLMTALSDRVEPFVLHCDAATMRLLYFKDGAYFSIEQHRLEEPLRAFPHRSDEYDAVAAEWLSRYSIELVHLRHLVWHGLGLVDVAKDLDLPVVFSFHDFYTICPSVNLVDERNVYCAGKCTSTEGACRYALWGDQSYPPLKHAAVRDWQKQMGGTLQRCDAFVTTSESTREILLGLYPFLRERPFHVLPHGRDFEQFDQLAAPIENDEPIRIVVPGNLSLPKGARIAADLARWSRTHRIELHVMGALSQPLTPPKNYIYHGTYRRDEFASRVQAIRPHVGGVFSICAETYCHTLTELWASGVPVIGFDYGAVAERIRESGAGWLASRPTAEAVLELIHQLRADPLEHARKVKAVQAWQKNEGHINTRSRMGKGYFELYRSLLPGIAHANGASRGSRQPPEVKRTRVAALLPLQSGILSATGYIRGFQPLRHREISGKLELATLAEASSADAVFAVRNAITVDTTDALLTELRASGKPMVLDLDDALFDLEGHPDKAAYRATMHRLERTLTEANEVWTTTEYLAAKLRAYNSNVHVIPNALDEALWNLSSLDERPESEADRPLRLIYMGSRTHRADLLPVLNALEPLYREGRIEVAIIRGMRAADIPSWVRDITPPVEDVFDYPSFVRWLIGLRGQFDLGLAPLEDTEFNRCKSPIKLFDYAGVGLATVCSDVGPYRADRFPAFRISGGPSDWVEFLDQLSRDRAAIAEKRALAIAELQRRGTLASLGKVRLERLSALIG
jgi:GT2 family glycosyltransferase/glycosyltransferase involved in cell wall biosynthesis